MQVQLDRTKGDVNKLEVSLKEQKILYERSVKEVDILNTRLQKLQGQFTRYENGEVTIL